MVLESDRRTEQRRQPHRPEVALAEKSVDPALGNQRLQDAAEQEADQRGRADIFDEDLHRVAALSMADFVRQDASDFFRR